MPNLMSQACERCWRRKQKEVRPPQAHMPAVPISFGYLFRAPAWTRRRSVRPCIATKLLEAQTGQASPQQSQHDPSTSPASDARTGSERRASRSSVSRAAGCRDSIQAEMGSLSLAAMAEFTREQSSLPRARTFLSFETLFRSSTGVAASNLSRSDTPNPAMAGILGDFHRTLLAGSTTEQHRDQESFQRLS
ncbi:hypothetical protein PG996_001178 [Apiospora saccharicola]|uniref:Uncharacterized protein n=1 Tax=Apiospora saccharicola TaxID=335842 RepID=A0ABR1WFV9_9PEZI